MSTQRAGPDEVVRVLHFRLLSPTWTTESLVWLLPS